MKRLDIVKLKIDKLSNMLLTTDNPKSIMQEIRKYILEKQAIYKRQYDKKINERIDLLENKTYKELLTGNIEFDALFLELICKYPHIVDDMTFLMPIVNFINAGDKIDRLNQLLAMNRNVFTDAKLLNRINDKNYDNIKNIFKSLTLMASKSFRDYFKYVTVTSNRNYDNILLMEKALKEGLNLDLVVALGSENHASEYFRRNMSKELLDHIANAKTKTLKKQILGVMYNCNDDKILSILVRFLEIEEVRDQLLNENSFYYQLLIKPIYEGISHKEYGSINELLSTCSKEFDSYILACNSTDNLAHAFDCLTGPYIYYHKDRRVHAVPVNRFTSSFNRQIDEFNQVLDMVNTLDSPIDQEFLSRRYEKALNDNLRVIAAQALGENEDVKMTDEEIANWNAYIDATYGDNYVEPFDEDVEVTIGYGLDEFAETKPITMIYPYFRKVIHSSEISNPRLAYKAK